MDNLEPGEIVYCNITYKYKKQYRNRTIIETAEVIDVVFGREYECSYPHLDYKKYSRDIKKINPKKPLECDVEVIDLQVHARTGFKSKNRGYTLVKNNNESRNKTTGAYE